MTALLKHLPLRRWFLPGLVILLFGPRLFALDPSKTLFQYNIQTWNRQNGLPFNRISAITQTTNGYLWMGTQNGLVCFDGVDFTRTAIPNRPGWRSMSVKCLTPSPRGGLWFGLDAGAFGYLNSSNHFESFRGDWLNNQMFVSGIAEEQDGTVWIGHRLGILGLIGGKTNQPVLNSDVNLVQTVYEDARHRVWFGTFEKGLFYLEGGKLMPFPAPELLNTSIRVVAMDRDERLWVGTSYGLRVYDRDFKRNDPLTVYTEVMALLPDQHGAMWIGTSGDGLIRYYNGEARYIRKTNGLAEDHVNSLFEDREGSLWVGTRDGLTQISELKFPVASTSDGLLNDAVHGVCASSNGGLWCATSTGAYNYLHQTASYLPQPTNGTAIYTKRVFEARNGDVYTITGNREIYIYSGGKIIKHYSPSEWPIAFAEDRQSVIVGIGGRLFRINRSELTPYVFKGATPELYWVRDLQVGRDGSLLVASSNGAFRIHDDTIEHWTAADGLGDPDVQCITEDNGGTLWIGQVTGLARVKNNKVARVHLGPDDPLVNSIVPDNLGNLWMACSTGIIRVNLRSANEVADRKSSNLDMRLFDGMDALRTIDLTETEAVACKTADGKIWFPGPLGPVEIDPAHIPTNPVEPPVYIQKVLVDGIPHATTNAVPRGGGELAFQYTAISFIAPQKIRFRYKLEGYDIDWIDGGSQRSALYANLKPGKYTFRVEAANVDGVWNTHGASYSIELPPEFYQTAWFQTVCVAAFLLCLSGIYGWRTRHLRKKEKQLEAANVSLENKIRERTRELAEKRNLLRTLIDNLPDAVFVKDTEGHVIIDNLAHARYLGFSDPASSIGKTDFDCFPREKAEQFRGPELELLQSGKEYNGEECLTFANGDTCWFRTTKVPLRDDSGKIIGLAGINRDITERKKWEAEMELLHKQLLETSRHAGMAEVATSVLHNVGNVLNSVNVSASVVGEQVRSSNLERLTKVISLLQENRSDLSAFFKEEEKGTKLISFLEALFVILSKERETVQDEVEALTKNVEHIKKIVAMQQSYAKVSGVIEIVNPSELIEDSLRMHEAAFQRHAVKIVRDYSKVPKIAVDRHKVIQILVNLLGNAKYACDPNDPANRIIRVRLGAVDDKHIRIEIIDNGVGIPVENVTRIFSYGFTTRKNGHGFGLHSGALAAKEMGGSLNATSGGPGKGAVFTLELPVEYTPPTKTRPDDKFGAEIAFAAR